ncbi:MAG: DUF2608 domain-containing protein [Puniceicoccales bacterium]|jgi:hypothetical protein|nr:DUF2608 domain-containing protein [Puniceicoccales bacterium]
MEVFSITFKIFVIVACSSTFAHISNADDGKVKILQASDIGTIKRNINRADRNTLVVFDCDDVLTTVKDAVLKSQIVVL